MKKLFMALIIVFLMVGVSYAREEGFTITFHNIRDDMVVAYLYHVDHGIKDYNRPLNVIGVELTAGKKFKGEVTRPPGKYIAKVYLTEEEMETIVYFTVYSNIVHINVYIKMDKVALIPSQEI